MSKVYFIGAGPGDPELITVKGRKLLDSADVVIYAGSLVNPELLKDIKAEVVDSSKLTLDGYQGLLKTPLAKIRWLSGCIQAIHLLQRHIRADRKAP